MTTPLEALDDVLAATRTVPGVGSFRGDQAGKLRTPAIVVSLPVLRWVAYCAEPQQATFKVSVVVALDEYAMTRLLGLVPTVHAAIEANTPATVTDAIPVPFDAAAATMASYELTVEYPL